MNDAILLLELEHRHAATLLKLIERQGQAEQLDYALLGSICEYFSDYPDQCHHPVENLVFSKLEQRDPTGAAQVGEILAQHPDLARMTENLAAAVARARQSSAAEPALREALQRFVELYYAHMTAEEQEFFPLAVSALSHADWGEVTFALFERSDPLFNRQVEDRFAKLRDHIEEAAKQSGERAERLRKTGFLQSLTDPAAFNRWMTDSGQGYSLNERSDGSYALQRDGEVIADIPKCSPGRAAWCAYYFVDSSTAG